MSRDLTKLQRVKNYLKITDSESDALLQRMITAASDYIQSILNREFAKQTYAERNSGNGQTSMVLANYPVLDVSAISINGVSIPLATGDTDSGFLFDADAVYLRGYQFTRGTQNVLISYTAGFVAVPPTVEDCCIELVAKKFKYKDRIGQVSKILGGETVTFEKSDLTDDMKSVLRNYQKVVPV